MSSLSNEVAQELAEMKQQGSGVTWWQRAILITAANALGVLIGGGLLGFCTIVWNKAGSTDALNQRMDAESALNAAMNDAILNELAQMAAKQDKRESEDAVFPEADTTAQDVLAAKERIQQRLDKAIYRQQQLSAPKK